MEMAVATASVARACVTAIEMENGSLIYSERSLACSPGVLGNWTLKGLFVGGKFADLKV